MDPQQTQTPGTPIYQESEEKNAKWLWLLIVLIIIGSLVFAFVRGIGPFSRFSPFTNGDESESTFSPTPISSPISFESPSPEATAEAEVTQNEVDKSEPKIRVLNGSGKTGAAAALKDFLEDKDYQVTAIGNAESSDFEQTELRFKEGFGKFQESLISDLSDDYSVKISSEGLSDSDDVDIEIIVGSK